MPKCWIHGETAEKKPTKPLKTHPGFPEDSIKQGLAIALVSKPPIRDWAIQPYRHWEFEGNINKIKKLKEEKEQLKTEINLEKENLEKQKGVLTQFLESYWIKTGELADLKAFIDNLILRDKKVGEFLKKHKAKNFAEISKRLKDYQELLNKIELLEI